MNELDKLFERMKNLKSDHRDMCIKLFSDVVTSFEMAELAQINLDMQRGQFDF